MTEGRAKGQVLMHVPQDGIKLESKFNPGQLLSEVVASVVKGFHKVLFFLVCLE